jgi:enoyl-CoA hydratase/carnithine racemase
MADEVVLYEARYPAVIITLNNPDHRNALSAAMIDALMAAIAPEDTSHISDETRSA